MIEFDDRAAQTIQRLYQTPDIVAQRACFLDALAAEPGERILDVGIGPGLLAWELARVVGSEGTVRGIDLSDPMIAMTSERCHDMPWARFEKADATSLPFRDESFDAVVSTQVYEYVPDIAKALGEVRRVLRPGGRVWILDTDWRSVVWNTRDQARMRRMLDAWDAHLHDPHLPATIATRLRAAGLQVLRQQVIPILNTCLHRETYSHSAIGMISNFVSGSEEVPAAEVDAWAEELRELGRQNDYFFSINRYLVGAIRA